MCENILKCNIRLEIPLSPFMKLYIYIIYIYVYINMYIYIYINISIYIYILIYMYINFYIYIYIYILTPHPLPKQPLVFNAFSTVSSQSHHSDQKLAAVAEQGSQGATGSRLAPLGGSSPC